MAFPLEQAWYVPTQVVAVDPRLVGSLWHGPDPKAGASLENVPPFTPKLSDQYSEWAKEAMASFGEGTARSTLSLLVEIGEEKVVEVLCRLGAPSQARALVVPGQLWPGRAGEHPWCPLRIEQVALLDDARLTHLEPPALAECLRGTPSDPYGLLEDEISNVLTDMLGRAVNQRD
jgi:DNA-binding transcriptional ArsR family regulator